MPLGIKTGPTLGVTSWNQRNKDVEFICRENDSGERSRAIMALLFIQPKTTFLFMYYGKPYKVTRDFSECTRVAYCIQSQSIQSGTVIQSKVE